MRDYRPAAVVPGRHAVAEMNFSPEVTAGNHFPTPLGLIDSTLRKTFFTAGAATTQAGFLRIAEALVDLGIKDECLNVNWSGSTEPSPQEWQLLKTIIDGDFGFRLNVYADALLSDGRNRHRVSPVGALRALESIGVRIAAPGIVEAPDEEARKRQLEEMEEYFAEAHALGVETTITLAHVGRRNVDRMLEAANHAVRLGARRLDLMDSTSSLSPDAMPLFIRNFRSRLVKDIPITMHVHDEFGLATAGAVAAARAGASPDVAVNGVSYRAGFASLEEVVLAMETLYGVDTGIRLDQIQRVSRIVAREMGMPVPPLKPLTGSYAFLKHMPGDVVQALDKGSSAFPPISHGLVPTVMGQRVTWVWGGISSDPMTRALAEKCGLVLAEEEVPLVKAELDQLARRKGTYPQWLSPVEASNAIFDVLADIRGQDTSTAHPLFEPLFRVFPYRPWVERVIAASASLEEAIASTWTVINEFDDDEIISVLDVFNPLGHEPERSTRGEMSRSEEKGILTSASTVQESINQACKNYEDTFGHIFLIAAAGMSGDEVLQALQSRLLLSPDEDLRCLRKEMAAVITGRLARPADAGRVRG